MIYRKEIDGLRALAVLAVVIFHVGVTQLSGGYLGVDVFFTISGFLITSILIRDLTSERFSFKHFYLRRIRRLIPALLVTIICTWIAGLFFLTPDHLVHLSKSSITAAFSISNIFFWMDAGYFSDAALNKPLLHSWSLSVEEQFYLIWPALLLFLVGLTRDKSSKKILWIVIFILSALSILAAELSLGYNPSTSFYLTPFRIAEFGIGALCIPLLTHFERNKLLSTLSFWFGVSVILLCFIAYESSTRFPGLNSLVPSLATGAVILGGRKAFGQVVLSNPIMTWIGKISYSLYLVHWPVVVYYMYGMATPLGIKNIVAMFIISLGLAVLLYYGVERIFRDTRKRESRQTYPRTRTAALTSILIGTLAFSVYGWQGKGLNWRLPADVQKYTSADEAVRRNLLNGGVGCASKVCSMGYEESNREIVLFSGDSHMHHYFAAFNSKLTLAKQKGIMVQDGACPFFTNDIYSQEDLKDSCSEQRNRFWSLADSNPKSPIIISQNWGLYQSMLTPDRDKRVFPEEKESYTSYELYLKNEVQKFIDRAGERTILIIGPTPQARLNETFATCLLKPNLSERFFGLSSPNAKDSCLTMPNIAANFELAHNINDLFSDIAKVQSNVYNLDPFDVLCDEDKCTGATDKTIYYRDNSHLSVSGSKFLLDGFENRISEVIKTVVSNSIATEVSSITFADKSEWFIQAKAKINETENSLNVEFPNDGRITFKNQLSEAYPGPFKLSMKANIDFQNSKNSDLVKFRVILQRGCDHVPLEGQSFDYTYKNTVLTIEPETIIFEPAECIMARIWNEKTPFSVDITDIQVTLSPL